MYQLHLGDCLQVLSGMPEKSVHCCVTSPPYYGLRDYGVNGQIGLEPTPDEYVAKMVDVFREVRRVLRDDGTLWLNLGDGYARNGGGVESKMKTAHKMGVGQKNVYAAGGMQSINKVPIGLKEKDLIGIPWRVAFALQADGWYLRQDIIWHKPNPMPESVTDRCTKAHEYIFLLTKQERYYYDAKTIQENSLNDKAVRCVGGNKYTKETQFRPQSGKEYTPDGLRNKRSVWTVTTKPFNGAHFAVFPPELIEPCILAGCPIGGVVLDPFTGSGTAGMVSVKHGRKFVGIELNPDYYKMAQKRIGAVDNTPRLFAASGGSLHTTDPRVRRTK